MEGHDPKDDGISQGTMWTIPVKVRYHQDQSKEHNHKCTLTDYMKCNFLRIDQDYFEKVSTRVKQEFKIKLACILNIFLVTFSEVREPESIDVILKNIFEDMNDVVLNQISTGGLDPNALEENLMVESQEHGIKLFAKYDQTTGQIVYIYHTKDANDVDRIKNSVFQKMLEKIICSMKAIKINIDGLKHAVEETEQKLQGELQQKETCGNQQDKYPRESRHETDSPVNETNVKDASKKPSKKEMNTHGARLSKNDKSETNMEGNDATTKSNAQGNNAPKDGNLNNDKNNDDTTESDSLGKGTPKTEFLYEGAFKPKSKNALKLLMKQGSLDDFKTKYKCDIEINKFGVILKVSNIAQVKAAKDELSKREESFEFVKKSVSLPYMHEEQLDEVIRQSNADLADVVVFQDESNVSGQTQKQSSTGRRWSHSKGHKIYLINGQVEHHWEELMIEIVVRDGKTDGPKKCENGRWKATLCIPKAEDSKDLHHFSEIFRMMLNNVREHYSICMSLEPIGNFQVHVNKYAREMLHTVQIWLDKRGVPVSLYLCAPESYETYIRSFYLPSWTYSKAEDITVETITRSMRLTIIGLEDSNFQQAEEKVRKMAEEIKLKEDPRKPGSCCVPHNDDLLSKNKIIRSSSDDDLLKHLGPLPDGWEKRIDRYDKAYYVNHKERTTQWKDPRLQKLGGPEDPRKPGSCCVLHNDDLLSKNKIIRSSSDDDLFKHLGPLPDGWEKRIDRYDQAYYVNHKERTTQWKDPRLQKLGGPSQKMRQTYEGDEGESQDDSWLFGLKKTYELQPLKKTALPNELKKEMREAKVRECERKKDILWTPNNRLIESSVKVIAKPKYIKEALKKSDNIKATAKPKEVTEPVKKSDTVEIQEVPALVYELLKIKVKLGELNQKGEKIEYSNGCLRCPSAVQKLSEKLKKMELEEIVLQGEEEKMDVKTFCDEINKNMKKELCVYDSEKQRVILFADAYDDMQKVKHQLNVKLERIKVTGRRGRRQMKTLKDTSPQIKIDFVWNRDSKNKEVFKTKEGMHVYVYEASIIKLPVECIVNDAIDTMMHGGGIARVIARAAGKRLDTECSTILRNSGKVQVGRNIVTTAGDLPYRCVIHAVGPRWSDYYPHTQSKVKECEQDLYDAVYGSLAAAENQGLKTIALPAISSAIFGVPERLCVYQYAKATLDYSKKSAGKDSCLTEVHFIDINADIVKKIQAMFITMVRDDKDPGYDSQEFVTSPSSWSSSSRDHHHSGQGNFQKDKQSQHWYSPDVPNGEDKHRFQGNLHVHNEDLFLLKIRHKTAVVMFVDDKLQPHGQVAGKLVSSIKWKETNYYRKERDEKKRNYGSIFVTNGYGCGFDNIIHVVSQGFKNTKSYQERKNQVMVVYSSILDLALRVKPIAAVVLTLIRTGGGQDDTKLSSEAIKKCYDDKMLKIAERNLEVHIVCNDDKVHVVFHTMDMKPPVPPSPRLEPQSPVSQQPGGYPSTSTSETWNNNNNQGASSSWKDNRNSGGDERDMMKDKGRSGANNEDKGDAGREEGGNGKENNCDQPDGTIRVYTNKYESCAGYSECDRIEINYNFPSGRQGPNHPSPGTWYKGISRTAYLPDNKDGREICEMLKVAFHRRLVFTIGRSTTTGQEGVITWNDMQHKTDPTPFRQFGYPDDTYLNRVREELAAKGITPKDIPAKSSSY